MNQRNNKSQIGLIFHHGWGYDSSYWKNLAPLFDGFRCEFFDAGYFNDPKTPELEDGVEWIGIGHSIGFPKLMEKVKNLKAIVGLQAFLDFSGSATSQRKKRSIIMQMTIDAFKKAPIDTLKAFRGNDSEFQKKTSQLNFDLLLEDLENLRKKYSMPEHLTQAQLIMATRNDPVLDLAVVEHDFSNVKFMSCNGHRLGYENHQEVHRKIMDFLNQITQ